MPSLRAAAVKPPLSATRVKTVRARNLFMVRPQPMRPRRTTGTAVAIYEKISGSADWIYSKISQLSGIFGNNQFRQGALAHVPAKWIRFADKDMRQLWNLRRFPFIWDHS
jgi:hypothetical protein